MQLTLVLDVTNHGVLVRRESQRNQPPCQGPNPPESPVAAGELDRVLHELAHDGAAELVRELVPLLLLLQPLDYNLVSSLSEILKPVKT